MEKIITKELFANSYFAIGGGITLSPLLKMSHLTTDFIFCNLYLTKHQVKTWYDKNIARSMDLELLDYREIHHFDELQQFELPANYTQYLHKPPYMSKEEFNGYMSTFQAAKEEPQFCLIYTMYRHSVQKELTLYFIVTEGFATLNLMSENGLARMPKVVECIQCGNAIDDGENGLLARFFSQPKVKTPLLWIRGHQPYYSKWTTVRSKSLVEAGPMPIVGMDFGTGWIAGNFNPGYKHDKRRYVKGFISESRYEELMDPCIAQKISTQKDQIVFESLVANIAAIPAEDILVINQHLATTYQISGENVVIWESLGFSHHHFQVFSSAEEMVEHLAAYLDRNGYSKTSKLHLIPYTTEDQGAAFIQSLSKLENATVTYLYRPLDLVDLRLQLN
jgi:hypothetical protein